MNDEFRLKLTFWGVRGSTPTPEIENLNYGGNTPCVEIRLPNGDIFILDAGSGIRPLGAALRSEFGKKDLNLRILLTHYHWDHIQGVPFFEPLYHSKNNVDFHAVGVSEKGRHRRYNSENRLEEALKIQMEQPYFPIGFDYLSAKKRFIEMEPEPQDFDQLTIHPFPLNHPGGAHGFRLESKGAVVVYATDLEHGDKELDKVVRDFSQEADLLIFDSQYTPEDYEKHRGWGHSTWLEACDVAREAKVSQLALFHHNPVYNDRVFHQIVQQARRKFENTIGAEEGWSLVL